MKLLTTCWLKACLDMNNEWSLLTSFPQFIYWAWCSSSAFRRTQHVKKIPNFAHLSCNCTQRLCLSLPWGVWIQSSGQLCDNLAECHGMIHLVKSWDRASWETNKGLMSSTHNTLVVKLQRCLLVSEKQINILKR